MPGGGQSGSGAMGQGGGWQQAVMPYLQHWMQQHQQLGQPQQQPQPSAPMPASPPAQPSYSSLVQQQLSRAGLGGGPTPYVPPAMSGGGATPAQSTFAGGGPLGTLQPPQNMPQMSPGALDPSMGSMPLGPLLAPTVPGRGLANWGQPQPNYNGQGPGGVMGLFGRGY